MAVNLPNAGVVSQLNKPIANPILPINNPVIVGAENEGEALPPTEFTSLNAGDIGAPVILNPDSEAVIVAPVVVGAESAGAIATPTAETAQTPATVATPSLFASVAVGAVAPPFPLEYARILYDNLLIGASVSVTTGTGGSLTLIPNTYESWRFTGGAEITFTLPLNVDIDTFCVGAHNLGSETFSVGVDFSSATTGAFSPFTTGQTPTDNKSMMFHRSSTVDVRRIKLVCSGTGSISIGSIYAGVALQLMRPFYAGFTPPRWAEKTTYRNTNSSTGNFLGRDIVRVGGETSINVNNLDNDWVETHFMPFKNAVKLSPYYIAWNLAAHPLDVALCQTSEDIELSPNGIRDLVQASWSAMIYGSL